jgi:hypothetical protein
MNNRQLSMKAKITFDPYIKGATITQGTVTINIRIDNNQLIMQVPTICEDIITFDITRGVITHRHYGHFRYSNPNIDYIARCMTYHFLNLGGGIIIEKKMKSVLADKISDCFDLYNQIIKN